ncbi:hypothetical protein AVO45_11185 [Ruegeria marisrubri]|uniref:Uncharacterized protein n=1 Tax=Ruegeria marisrubri TaxID=1685379 RepID=A0A0X3TKP7_9RHOB|nr:hypothetical protein AVO45_11185 [Ruegeria marisrubri]
MTAKFLAVWLPRIIDTSRTMRAFGPTAILVSSENMTCTTPLASVVIASPEFTSIPRRTTWVLPPDVSLAPCWTPTTSPIAA